jgi:hypothetical protein
MNRKNNYLVLAIISFADVGSIRYWLTTPQKYKIGPHSTIVKIRQSAPNAGRADKALQFPFVDLSGLAQFTP